MKIVIGTIITLVRPNTSVCPIKHSLEKLKFYNPIISYDMEVASEVYTSNKHSCFDVIGDSGTKNKGQKEGTRKVYFYDLGVVPIGDRAHMECGGITKSFTDKDTANAYMAELLNERNIINTYSRALEMWGMNCEEKQVTAFMELNNKHKEVCNG